MKVKLSEVKSTLLKIIVNHSQLDRANAAILAEEYIEGELQGKKTHGLAAFPAIVSKLTEAKLEYKVLKETDAFMYVDAQGSFGILVGHALSDKLINKAKSQGVALALIRDMKSWLRPASLAQYMAEHDMVGWVVNSGGTPMISPPGGKEPVIGTNPIGIGIPAADQPIIMDMATSTRAWGEVREAKRTGQPLPPNAYLDKNGQLTRDPDAAYSALPMAEYKGFGLGLFIEILGGSLLDMPMGKVTTSESYRTRHRGAAILVINPAMTVGHQAFKQQNEAYAKVIRNSPPIKQGQSISIPGDRSAAIKKRHLQNGYLEVDAELWQEIKSLLSSK